jgi:hypothetical protein
MGLGPLSRLNAYPNPSAAYRWPTTRFRLGTAKRMAGLGRGVMAKNINIRNIKTTMISKCTEREREGL